MPASLASRNHGVNTIARLLCYNHLSHRDLPISIYGIEAFAYLRLIRAKTVIQGSYKEGLGDRFPKQTPAYFALTDRTL